MGGWVNVSSSDVPISSIHPPTHPPTAPHSIFDKASNVFLQLSEFLGSGKLSEKYLSLIPSLEDMLVRLQLDPEVSKPPTHPPVYPPT